MTTRNPYKESASDYVMAGWDVFPLPYARKSPPPKGVTGSMGESPSEELMLLDWMEMGGNIGLRLHAGIVGIDIDGKKGYGEFQGLESRLGKLPISIVSSSHEDRDYGFTAFFRVPTDVKFKSGLGSKIDILQETHRYQVVAPSIHPSGREYSWMDYDTFTTTPYIPQVEDTPALPKAWLDYVTLEAKVDNVHNENKNNDNVVDFVIADLNGSQCAQMKKVANGHIFKLKKLKTSRHDALITATWAIVSAASSGHTGGKESLNQYGAFWMELFASDDIGNRDLFAEFNAAVNTAQSKQQAKTSSCHCKKYDTSDRSVGIVTRQKMWR